MQFLPTTNYARLLPVVDDFFSKVKLRPDPMNRGTSQSLYIINKIHLLIGLLVLCLGALVYVTHRSPDLVYFTKYFGIQHALFEVQSPLLNFIGYRLPAFAHVFALILITASFFHYSKRAYLVICGGWFLIDTLFELGQKYKTVALSLGLDFFDNIHFLEGWRNYFLLGTFDILDLVAYALGAAVAFWVLTATAEKRRSVDDAVQ
jgi:hypothetical protein